MGESLRGAAGCADQQGGAAYRERRSRLGGAVLWSVVTRPDAGPVLPDGCTDLIWSEGRLLVAGPDTGPQSPEAVPHGTRFVGLRFAPGQGPAVFGVSARELRDRRVPLEDLWPAARVRRLAERMAQAGAPGRLLEETAAARLRELRDVRGLRELRDVREGAPDTSAGAGGAGPAGAGVPGRAVAIGFVAEALGRGRRVGEVARAVGLSERQLHRRCLDAFGYGPKTLARVLRLVRALELARGGVPYAEVAVRAGYADQAHLAREVRSLAGAPMGAVLGSG